MLREKLFQEVRFLYIKDIYLCFLQCQVYYAPTQIQIQFGYQKIFIEKEVEEETLS